MPSDADHLYEAERLLTRINLGLQEILADPSLPAPLAASLKELERLSRFRRSQIGANAAPFALAAVRADVKAKEYGEPFVVAETTDGKSLVVVSKARLKSEAPYAMNESNVVYETRM